MKGVTWRPAGALLLSLSKSRADQLQAEEDPAKSLAKKEMSYTLLRQKILSILRRDGDSEDEHEVSTKPARKQNGGQEQIPQMAQMDGGMASVVRQASAGVAKEIIPPCSMADGNHDNGSVAKGWKANVPLMRGTTQGRTGIKSVSRQSTLTTDGSVCSEPSRGKLKRKKKKRNKRRPEIVLRPPSPPEVATAVSEATDEERTAHKQHLFLKVPQVQKSSVRSHGQKQHSHLLPSNNDSGKTTQHVVPEIQPEPEENKTKQGHVGGAQPAVTSVSTLKTKHKNKDGRTNEQNNLMKDKWKDISALIQTRYVDDQRNSDCGNSENQSTVNSQVVTVGINTDLTLVSDLESPFKSVDSGCDEDAFHQDVDSLEGGALECWTLYNRLAAKGCKVSLTTLHRALLSPTELRLLEESTRIKR